MRTLREWSFERHELAAVISVKAESGSCFLFQDLKSYVHRQQELHLEAPLSS